MKQPGRSPIPPPGFAMRDRRRPLSEREEINEQLLMNITAREDRLFEDWLEFATLQQEACDIDPLYPVLGSIFAEDDPEYAAWKAIVYVAYYNAPSALTALSLLPIYGIPEGDLARLPTGIERRGLRGGGPLTKHLRSVRALADGHDGVMRWLQADWQGTAEDRWQATRFQFERAWGNGRWASYKMAEVLQKALGWPIEAPDMGMTGATGPRGGLRILFGDADDVEAEAQGRWLRSYAAAHGLKVDLAEVETCLCDFHSLADGRYYVGHDVALLWEDTHKLPAGPVRQIIESTAERVLPEPYWRSMLPALKRQYRDTGRIAWQ